MSKRQAKTKSSAGRGEFLFIPASVPREAINWRRHRSSAVAARNDAAEQDKVEPYAGV